MTELRIDNRLYLQSDLLKSVKSISHCFTTKIGGVSCGKIEGLNLGYRVGDEKISVDTNYRFVAKDIGFSFERITAGHQTHSANIQVITEDDAGKGVSRISDFTNVDGLVTNVRDLPIVVYYADCVPILLADETKGVVAAVHSGWRGTVEKIAAKAVEVMMNQFGSSPLDIKAAIGPSIGPCCFETGDEVACNFDKSLVSDCENGKFMVNLWQANENILLGCGLKRENIDTFKMCTICNSDTLYSYRTHKESTGRMGAFVVLK